MHEPNLIQFPYLSQTLKMIQLKFPMDTTTLSPAQLFNKIFQNRKDIRKIY